MRPQGGTHLTLCIRPCCVIAVRTETGCGAIEASAHTGAMDFVLIAAGPVTCTWRENAVTRWRGDSAGSSGWPGPKEFREQCCEQTRGAWSIPDSHSSSSVSLSLAAELRQPLPVHELSRPVRHQRRPEKLWRAPAHTEHFPVPRQPSVPWALFFQFVLVYHQSG